MNSQKPSLHDLLYLLTIPNIGPGRIRRLFQTFSSVQQILKAPVQQLVRIEGIDYKLASQIKKGGDSREAENQLKLIDMHKVKIVTIWEKGYPKLLQRIPDPPVLLFYRGKIDLLKSQGIAVVGTRKPSNYGRVAVTEIVRDLVNTGMVIVSGIARGIDAIAHHTALQNGGETIAVLGNGLDYCYPRENKQLFNNIGQNGVILSEYFLGTGPDAANFPKRNRIISGLSLGTLVVEAGDRSGALITAFYALNHNREVFAIPGNINSPQSRGTNRLIQQGAKLVQNVQDILDEISEFSAKKSIGPKPVPDNLSELENHILSKLSNEPKHIDRLVMEMSEAPSTILSGLLNLELLGLVQQLAGKMFIRL